MKQLSSIWTVWRRRRRRRKKKMPHDPHDPVRLVLAALPDLRRDLEQLPMSIYRRREGCALVDALNAYLMGLSQDLWAGTSYLP